VANAWAVRHLLCPGGYGCALSALTDPGPAARFSVVVSDPATPDVVVQRLAAGESLKEIAEAWQIPYRRFLAWIASNGELTETCKRVRELAGVELRIEGMELLDEATPDSPEHVALVKERAKYRESLARDLNRPLFGKQVRHEHTHTVDLGERLRRARERVLQAPEAATLGAVTPSAVTPGPAPEVMDAELI
jgi:hypothetical protein